MSSTSDTTVDLSTRTAGGAGSSSAVLTAVAPSMVAILAMVGEAVRDELRMVAAEQAPGTSGEGLPASIVSSGLPSTALLTGTDKPDSGQLLTMLSENCPYRSSLGPVRMVPLGKAGSTARMEPDCLALDTGHSWGGFIWPCMQWPGLGGLVWLCMY